MKRFFREILKQPGIPGLKPLRHALPGILAMGLFCLASEAMAAYTYRLVGTTCTDSNRAEIYYPDAGVWGPGPTLCSDQIAAEVTLSDNYVPGTSFHYDDQPGTVLDLTSFAFDDGVRSASTTFPVGVGTGGDVSGMLPVNMAPSQLEVFWHEGWFFQANTDGTWMAGVEFGARDGACGLGSIEGPDPTGAHCTLTQTHYFSVGTYQGWRLVPEPPAAAALALALCVIVSRRYRRR